MSTRQEPDVFPDRLPGEPLPRCDGVPRPMTLHGEGIPRFRRFEGRALIPDGRQSGGSLMLVRSGDREGGVAYAQAALAALPSEKHSLTLRMLMEEIKKP
ncbi:hypothetical protein [Streptomyces sp. NPDC046385]|uniref:hypothetical protein n=1 Tax=Streptomyces sp. NPDC046385 TaxID=3154918 RepID=UPI0033CC8D3D